MFRDETDPIRSQVCYMPGPEAPITHAIGGSQCSLAVSRQLARLPLAFWVGRHLDAALPTTARRRAKVPRMSHRSKKIN